MCRHFFNYSITSLKNLMSKQILDIWNNTMVQRVKNISHGSTDTHLDYVEVQCSNHTWPASACLSHLHSLTEKITLFYERSNICTKRLHKKHSQFSFNEDELHYQHKCTYFLYEVECRRHGHPFSWMCSSFNPNTRLIGAAQIFNNLWTV